MNTYDLAHARSRTLQPIGGNFKPDLTLKTCLVQYLSIYLSIYLIYLPIYLSLCLSADPNSCAVKGEGLRRSLACWDCGFESRRMHWYLSLLSVVCFQVEVSVSDHSSRGFVPSVVCLSAIVKHGQWGGPGPLGAVVSWGEDLFCIQPYIRPSIVHPRLIQWRCAPSLDSIERYGDSQWRWEGMWNNVVVA